MVEDPMLELLMSIARCPNLRTVFEKQDNAHPCSHIVGMQKVPRETFQLPEPWSGDLENAPILFLGSNPGYAPFELYPLWSWSDNEIADFFLHRFGGGDTEWVRGGLRPLLKDGTYKPEWVRYWAAVRNLAATFLDGKGPRPGESYAMSEVVHCKSSGERGVRSALETCVSRYLKRLVAVSAAKVIVCLGVVAAEAVQRTWGKPDGSNVHGPVSIGGRERYFVFLPHPNARSCRTVARCLADDEIRQLRQALTK